MYFPFCQNEFLTESKSELINETFNKILERIILNKKNLKRKSYINTKYKFLNDIKSFIEDDVVENKEDLNEEKNQMHDRESFEVKNENLDDNQEEVIQNEQKSLELKQEKSIDDYINKIQTCLNDLNNRNNSLFKSLTAQLKESEGKFSLLNGKGYNYDPDDVLNDLKYLNIYSKKFQNYLIKKNEDRVFINPISSKESGYKSNGCILSRLEEEELNNNPDDIVCVICNDGDYEDDDLIVYCSSCQMTVHQSCYGIVVLPKEDWICHPCLAFGEEKSKLIQCICCPVKGGAMKPSLLKKSSAFFNFITNLKQKDENESIVSNSKLKKSKLFVPILNYDSEYKNGFKENGKGINMNVNENSKENNENTESLLFSVLNNSNISNRDHEELKLNKNNNLIFNEKKGVNLMCNFLNENLRTKSVIEKEKEFSDINSTVLNETESKKTLASVMNSNTRKRGRQKKTNKNKNKNKTKKEENSEKNEKLGQDFITNCKAFHENAWIHLSCALWTPEIVIQDFARKDEIKSKIIFLIIFRH
jgi:hypothetical protein